MTLSNPADGPASVLPIASATDRGSQRRHGAATAPHPLTHHEIIRLIGPFTRRGRHVDLAASDRLERNLVFKPIVHEQEMAGCAGATEILRLENPRSELYRLIRILTLRNGVVATLATEGPHPGDLLARIEAIAPERQCPSFSDIVIAQSYRLEPVMSTPSEAMPPMRLVLTSAEARLKNLTLTLNAETGRGYPAEIELLPDSDCPLDLPDDLLATLGWNWRVLRRRGIGWTGTLRVPRREPGRSRRIEAGLAQAIAHVARTLAEPPRRFHARQVGARWGVMLRRAIPLLSCLALIAGTVALSFAEIPTDSVFQMLIFNFPPLLLIAIFGMRELPRLEIPPMPRPCRAPSWLLPSAAQAQASTTPDSRPG